MEVDDGRNEREGEQGRESGKGRGRARELLREAKGRKEERVRKGGWVGKSRYRRERRFFLKLENVFLKLE
jgi:hypothetical protein